MSELKPCPVCGKQPKIISCKIKHRDGFMKCRDSTSLMVAEAIEQLLEEAEHGK